jgi:hypothetical protein
MKRSRWVTTLSCSLLCVLTLSGTSLATVTDPLTRINLSNPVYFLAPDGSPLVTPPGSYTVEAAEEWLRLVPDERHDALLIEAKKGTHELDLTDALALSVTGTEDDGQDLHHVILLLPNGESLEATGTYSGIRPRGFFDQAVNNVKKQTNQAYKNAQSTAKKTASQAKSTAQQARKQAQQQTQKAASQAQKSAKSAQKQVQKGTQQAISTASQGVQTARNAALQAKQQIEQTAQQTAGKIKSGVQAGVKPLQNNPLVATLQSEIQTLEAVRKLKLESLFGCLAQGSGQASANLSQMVQRFTANPAGFATWMVNDFSTLLEKSFREIMSEQLQLLSNPPRSNLPGEQVMDMAMRSMDKLAQKHPAGRCLLQFSRPHKAAFRNASVQLQQAIRTQIKRIFDMHVGPVLYGSLNNQLGKIIEALLSLSPQDLAQSRIRSRGIDTLKMWQGELILPEDEPEDEIVSRGLRPINQSEGTALLKDLVGLGDIITVTQAVLADHLLNPRDLYAAATHVENLTKSLNNQAQRQAALGEVRTALDPYSPWTEALYIDIGMEILRVVGNNYLDSDLPGGGTNMVNLGVGFVSGALGGAGDVGCGAGGLLPEVGAAIVVTIKLGPELSKEIVLDDWIAAGIVGGLHFGYNWIIDEAKEALKLGKSYDLLQQGAGPLKALLRVLPGKQAVMMLADTHTKDMKKALVRYNQSVLLLAETAAE